MDGRTLQQRAIKALRFALRRAKPSVRVSDLGYVDMIEDNLVSRVSRTLFEEDLRGGDGNELESKFLAAHSSSALVVNAFAPFKKEPGALDLVGVDGFRELRFEAKCPTGLRGGRAPNLDLLAEGPGGVVGVESKCTEYLAAKTARFSDAYAEQIKDDRRDGPWFREMMALRERPDAYSFLDAAQLIKHAFGLARQFRDRGATLLYPYWEPVNADEFDIFRQHRNEIRRFSERVSGAHPAFTSMSYNDLWRDWSEKPAAAWLYGHVGELRARYAVEI